MADTSVWKQLFEIQSADMNRRSNEPHSFEPESLSLGNTLFSQPDLGGEASQKKEICPTKVEAAWLTGAECGYLNVWSWFCVTGILKNKEDEFL